MFALALGACRGTKQDEAPVAVAGADLTAWKGAWVVLDGTGSSGSAGAALTYRWTQVEGPDVALVDDRAARASFFAPRQSGPLRFSLVVGDASHVSAPDEVVVLVQNRAPHADTGPDQLAMFGEVAALDAGASTDPDGDPLEATWFQRSGPPVTLTRQPGGSATFVAPSAGVVLEFGLVVSDGEATSVEDRVRVQVVDPASNWPPVASAGPDREVPRRQVVLLQGSAVDREHDPLTWTWTQLAGPAVSLLGADTPTASFVAPAEEADLEFQLVASDGTGTGADRVVIQVRNQAPRISALAIGPFAPITTDPLVATWQASDPDGDPLALAWEWSRDGVVVPGVTTATVPPELTAKGETWRVRLVASDGRREAIEVAEMVIVDAPPVVTLDGPATVAWGEPLQLSVVVSDPDGDPVGAPYLVYGPAGMTATAGGIAWTPTLPMFDRAMDVSFAVGVTGLAGFRSARVVTVLDPGRELPLRRGDLEIPVRNGLVAADLDGDGRAELLVSSRDGLYELGREGAGYAIRWMYPFAVAGNTPGAVAAHDLDGDGHPEIFLATSPGFGGADPAAVVVLDGVTRRERARLARNCLALEVADVDQDGSPELACLASSVAGTTLALLDARTLALRWETAPLALGAGLAIGNVDADPALEIVTSGGFVFDGATGANQWAYGGGFGMAVDTGDLDGDGVEEIVGMDDWSRFRGFSAVVKSPLWEKPTSDNDALLVADVDGDGRAEVVVGDGQWGNVTAWKYDARTNTLAPGFQLDSQEHGVSALAAGDLDGDGKVELAWGSGATSSGGDVFVVATVSPAAVQWRSGPGFGGLNAGGPAQLDGPFVGGKLARAAPGGAPFLLFFVPSTNSGYDGSRLVRLDPVSGGVAQSAEIGSNWSRAGALDVADVNGDGADEALLATANLYSGYLAAWDLAGGAVTWSTPPGSGSASALAHADLNGDGIPDLVAISAEGYVTAWDVRSAALLWKSTSLGVGRDVAVADLDGDGQPEIVALGTTKLTVFKKAASGPVPWLEAASAVVADAVDLEVADADGDGVPEVYVLSGWSTSMTVRRYDGALVPQGAFTVPRAVALFVEDLGTPRKNLLVAVESDWIAGGANGLEARDPVTGDRVWASPPLCGRVGPNSLGYVDLGAAGARAIALGTTSSMYLTR